MKKQIAPLTITAPARPGEPATLDCSPFQGHIDLFEDSLAQTWLAEFPGVTIEQLGVKAKCDSGFERFFATCVAVGFAAGQRAAHMSALVEAAAVKSRAATATKVVEKTFTELVSDQVKTGKTKSDSVRFCIQNFPKQYAAARVVGIASL